MYYFGSTKLSTTILCLNIRFTRYERPDRRYPFSPYAFVVERHNAILSLAPQIPMC
jgi:hypothetical protein